MSSDEIRRLVHELEVHQIELAMQNEELCAAEVQLAESRDHLSDLYDFAPVGYLTLGEDSTIVAANLAAGAMLEVERERALGQKFTRFVAPDSQDAFYLHQRSATPVGAKQTGELLLRNTAGKLLSVQMDMACVADALTGALSWYIAISDISERKRNVDALHQALQRAEAAQSAAEFANQAKSQFLANMSHEIRTPLNGMLGMTELLLGTALDGEQVRFAHIARRSGEALLSLVNDILDLSKIESGKLELETIPFDPWEIVEDVALMFAERAHAKGLALLWHVEEDVPTLAIGDPGRLRQIISNLVGNAIKFTETGQINILLQRQDSAHPIAAGECMIRLNVADTGIGMSEAERARLFRPFSQADSSTTRRYGGTGLGLAIAKQLTEAMGGTIEVESAPGKGSSFRFTARLGTCASADAPVAIRAQHEFAGRRALIVENDAIQCNIVRRQFETLGLIADEAHDPTTAIAMLRSANKRYDVVVIDMKMPGVREGELGRTITAQHRSGAPRLVLLNSRMPGNGAVAPQVPGFVAELNKPVGRAALKSVLRNVLAIPKVASPSALQQTAAAKRAHVLLADDNPINQTVACAMLRKLGYEVDAAQNGKEAVT
ncbi:MAG: ATP-binding protein, partial [Burkholderiales bacterium]